MLSPSCPRDPDPHPGLSVLNGPSHEFLSHCPRTPEAPASRARLDHGALAKLNPGALWSKPDNMAPEDTVSLTTSSPEGLCLAQFLGVQQATTRPQPPSSWAPQGTGSDPSPRGTPPGSTLVQPAVLEPCSVHHHLCITQVFPGTGTHTGSPARQTQQGVGERLLN